MTELVYKLLETMPRDRIALVHRRLAPAVQIDIVAALPNELALKVLSHLSYTSLLTCTLVSRRWRTLADDPQLWRALCAHQGWRWRWPRVPHDPVPLFTQNESKEDFDDEGVGEDEDADNTGSSSGQTISYHQNVHTYGLPATPRINPPPRTQSTRGSRHSTPPPSRLPVRAGSSITMHTPSVNTNRFSSPSILPHVAVPRPDYKLLYQTHILLRNRLAHGSLRFSTLQNRGTPEAHTSVIYCLQLYSYPPGIDSSLSSWLGWQDRANASSDSLEAGPRGRQVLFTGSKDRTVREWNMETAVVERVFEGGHTGSILSLCAHGPFLATASIDFSVCIWDLRTGSLVQTVRDHQDSVLCVRFDDRYLVSCSKDRKVRLYRFIPKNVSRGIGPVLDAGIVLGTHHGAVNAVSLSHGLVVSASADKSLRVWDAASHTLLRTFDAHHARGIAAIDIAVSPFSAQNRKHSTVRPRSGDLQVLSGSSDKQIRMFNTELARGWSTAPEFHDPLPLPSSLLSGDGGRCEACGAVERSSSTACDQRQRRRASVKACEAHVDLVRSVALGPEFVVSGSYDQSVKVCL